MTRDEQDDLLRQVDRLGSTKPMTAGDIPDAAAMRLYQEVNLNRQEQEWVAKILSLFAAACNTDRRYVSIQADLSFNVRKLFLDKGYRIESDANEDGRVTTISWW